MASGDVTIAQLGGGHPQRTMLLAWHHWNLTPPGSPATRELAEQALGAALRDRRPELEAILRGLPEQQQRTAIALGHGLLPASARAAEVVGISTRMSGNRAARALVERGHAEERSEGAPVLVDPLLAAHLRQTHRLERATGRARESTPDRDL